MNACEVGPDLPSRWGQLSRVPAGAAKSGPRARRLHNTDGEFTNVDDLDMVLLV